MASFLRLEAASRPLRGCVHVAVALLEKRFFAFFRNFWWRLSAFLQSILHSFTFSLFSRIFNFAPTSISSRFCLIWNWFGVPRARAFCAISSTLILQEIHIDSRLNFLHFVTRKLLCCLYRNSLQTFSIQKADPSLIFLTSFSSGSWNASTLGHPRFRKQRPKRWNFKWRCICSTVGHEEKITLTNILLSGLIRYH